MIPAKGGGSSCEGDGGGRASESGDGSCKFSGPCMCFQQQVRELNFYSQVCTYPGKDQILMRNVGR